MKKVGFTGTQVGMTDAQKEAFVAIIGQEYSESQIDNNPTDEDAIEFHHGDCIGADKNSHDLMVEYFLVAIIIHPPIKQFKRAFCKDAYFTHPKKDYLERNHDIVDSVDHMIATPKETTMQFKGSGTWATIRYSKKKFIRLDIIWPNGEVCFNYHII